MGLRRNIVASYVAQGYVTLASIIAMPLYLHYLGAEAYGLVGFFSMLQAWLMLLDMGLSPTLARETARFHGGALGVDDFHSLVRVLEGVFVAIALAAGAIMMLGAHAIATEWLQVRSMSVAEVIHALQIMAAIIALRWMCGVYRSVVTGAERLVWLANFGASIATVRFIGVLLVLEHIGATASVFFWYQLAVAVIELLVLAVYARTLIPSVHSRRSWRQAFKAVKPLIAFSLSLAFTASVWVFVTQTDKLILSKMLPLSEYGYFSLAVLLAGGIMVVSAPITGALLPSLTRLEAECKNLEMIHVYRQATQWVVVLAVSTSVTMALSAQPLLLAWTGNQTLALKAGPILVLYALGNGLLAVSAFPYYLQYAKGNLRMHVLGNVLFVLLLIPSIAWAAHSRGGVGAGYAWLVMNALYLVGWAPLVHRRLEPGLNLPWLGRDIAAVAIPAVVAGSICSTMLSPTDSREMSIAKITLLFTILAVVGAAATSSGWSRLRGALFAGARTTREWKWLN
jgi:O-antigen/teichoic acid export membrane protein